MKKNKNKKQTYYNNSNNNNNNKIQVNEKTKSTMSQRDNGKRKFSFNVFLNKKRECD